MKSSITSEKKPLFGAECLSRIPYSDKPLTQKGAKIIDLTPEQFKEKFGCYYTEDVYGDQKLADRIARERDKRLPTEREQKILDRLKNPLKDLVICYVNKEIGHVLVANKDFAANTILAIYAGEIAPLNQYGELGGNYAVPLDMQKELSGETKVISAYHVGGLARFMPDLPYDFQKYDQCLLERVRPRYPLEKFPQATDDFLLSDIHKSRRALQLKELVAEIKFHSKEAYENLAFCNVHRQWETLYGAPLTALIVDIPIKKHQVIGFIYDEKYGYWSEKRELPCLLTKEGEMISKSSYHFSPEGFFYQKITALREDDTKVQTNLALQIYEQGISAFKARDYKDAQAHVGRALKFFQKIPGKKKEITSCFLTLASCCRELKDFDSALVCWEKAMLVAPSAEIHKAKEKIHSFLSELSGEKLHKHAIDQYKEKHYELAAIELNLAIEKFDAELNSGKQAVSLSALASCYRELGLIELAQEAVTNALKLATTALGPEHEITKKIKTKKDQMAAPSLQVSVAAAIARGAGASSASLAPDGVAETRSVPKP